jgi:hypothetical protein
MLIISFLVVASIMTKKLHWNRHHYTTTAKKDEQKSEAGFTSAIHIGRLQMTLPLSESGIWH